MLAALEESLETQRRFVADASHELRTPLTSLQTNIEVLKQQERLQPAQRNKLFADLEREAHEMRDLITGLLELARGDANQEEHGAARRARREPGRARAEPLPDVTFTPSSRRRPSRACPSASSARVWNLLENAANGAPNARPSRSTLADGELRVRDHGPGIAPTTACTSSTASTARTAARALPGSGLGLAIVREVAEAHGGSVSAEEAPGGGALLRLRLANS